MAFSHCHMFLSFVISQLRQWLPIHGGRSNLLPSRKGLIHHNKQKSLLESLRIQNRKCSSHLYTHQEVLSKLDNNIFLVISHFPVFVLQNRASSVPAGVACFTSTHLPGSFRTPIQSVSQRFVFLEINMMSWWHQTVSCLLFTSLFLESIVTEQLQNSFPTQQWTLFVAT